MTDPQPAAPPSDRALSLGVRSATFPSMRRPPPLPSTVGPYRVLGQIGTGGFSRVYRVEREGSTGFRKHLALKVLEASGPPPEDLRIMFIDEASIASRLHHNNVVQVHEFGVADDRCWLVMDLVDGVDLRTLLRRLRGRGAWMPLPAAVELSVEVLHGLHHAHERRDAAGEPFGIVHRDVSPGNVLISEEGAVKIGDFGLARIRRKLAVTEVGVTRGTSRFMSPEQAQGLPVDGRSDVFAVGTLLYLMLAARAPFGGTDDAEIMRAVARAQAPPLSEVAPRTPPALVEACHAMLARDRTMRPRSALAAAERLVEAMDPAWGRQTEVLGRLVRRSREDREPLEVTDALRAPVSKGPSRT